MGNVNVSIYGKPDDIARLLAEAQRPPQAVNMLVSSDAVAKRILKLMRKEGLVAKAGAGELAEGLASAVASRT